MPDGLFSQPRMRDHDLSDLFDGRPFYLLRAGTREVTSKEFGDGVVADLYVRDETGVVDDETGILYSGFSAGIVRQVKESRERDFPTWARVERKQLSANRSTTILVPSAEGEQGERIDDNPDDIPF